MAHRQRVLNPFLALALGLALLPGLVLARTPDRVGAASVVQAPALPGAQSISSRDRVYTADQTSNTVSVYDPSTMTLLGTIPLGVPRPAVLSPLYRAQIDVHGLGFSPDGSLLGVISVTSNAVTIIETATNTVRGTVYLGRAPHEGFFTPDGKELWVAIRGESSIAVIDVATLAEVRRIPTAFGPGMVIFRPDGKYAFVDHSFTAEVHVIDTQTFQTVARVPVVSPFSPNLVATPDGKEVWLTHKDIGKVTRLDAQSFKVLEVLDTGKGTNHVNAVSTAAGDFIYVTVGGTDEVKVIERGFGKPSRIVATTKVGATPHGLWPSPDNSRVFIGLEDGDGIQVLDTTTNQVLKTIKGGQAPQALVYVANAVPSGDGRQGLTRQNVGLPVTKFKLKVPTTPFAFLPEALPKAAGTAVVRQLDGVDTIDLAVEGLPANSKYVAFLTEAPAAPFGAVEYLLAFTTDKEGKALAAANAVLFDAFALRGTAADGTLDPSATNATRRLLDHLVIWPADPATTADLFTSRGLPPAVTPFDEDSQAGPAILTDSDDPTLGGPLLNLEFDQTGLAIRGRFAGYWQAHGGLPIFGLPITPELTEISATDGKSYTVQYFERARFEAHPENPAPHDVLLGQLGRTVTQGRAGEPAFQPAAPLTGADYAEGTGHNLGGIFRDYWQQHGGLAIFGLPLSEEFAEVSPTDGQSYTVQYFERARFEHHPGNAAPNDVLLGLLGDQVLGVRVQMLETPAPARTQPVPSGWRTPMAIPVDDHCGGGCGCGC